MAQPLTGRIGRFACNLIERNTRERELSLGLATYAIGAAARNQHGDVKGG